MDNKTELHDTTCNNVLTELLLTIRV